MPLGEARGPGYLKGSRSLASFAKKTTKVDMTIHQFCKAKQITIGQLAKEIGYSYGTLRNVSAGQMHAGLKLIRSLERVSHGKISLKDLRPDLYQ